MRRLLTLVLIGTALALLLRTYVIEAIYIASASMEPAYPVGTRLFLEKVSLRSGPPRRGAVIVFPSPVEPEKDLVKRIIGLPGDTVELRNKELYLNGSLMEESYVQHTRPEETLTGDNLEPLKVPDGMVFVMGDNRDESSDSRDWKDPQTGEPVRFIEIRNIKGKIIDFYD